MSKLEVLANFISQLCCQVRIKPNSEEIPEAWARGIGLPVPRYIELHGPWPFREVEWLEINPIIMEHIGRLVKSKKHNYLENIISFLQSQGIAYAVIDEAVRIPFSELDK
jgi:hypothetical protein